MSTLTLSGHRIQNVELLVAQYESCWRETGSDYLDWTSNAQVLGPEDLAVTLAMNSQAKGLAFRTLAVHGPQLSKLLQTVPVGLALESPEATLNVLENVSALIAEVSETGRASRGKGLSALPNEIGISLATKLLHKKRPELLPVLDNQAIFRDYLNVGEPPTGRKAKSSVLKALQEIQADLRRPKNAPAWKSLHAEAFKRGRPRHNCAVIRYRLVGTRLS